MNILDGILFKRVLLMKKLLFVLVSMLYFTGCVPAPDFAKMDFPEKSDSIVKHSKIEESTKDKLKDGDSAKFKYPFKLQKAYSYGLKVPGLALNYKVNSKNSYGAYTGFKFWTAFYVLNKKTNKIVLIDTSSAGNSIFDIRTIEDPARK